jgi:hypothetical protein
MVQSGKEQLAKGAGMVGREDRYLRAERLFMAYAVI